MSDEHELITVKLTPDQYKLLQEMIKEKELYSLLASKLKNLWIWSVGAGLLTLFTFWDQISGYFAGGK